MIVEHEWAAGLNSIFKSYTTDVVFNSQSIEKQAQIISELLNLIQNKQKDYISTFIEYLRSKPFSLISIYVLLDSALEFVSTEEKADHLDKSHLDITLQDFGHFRYSSLWDGLDRRLTEFEAKGEKESASVKKIRE